MVLGRMVYNFTSKAKILGVKAWRFGLYFVLLDIVFVLQIFSLSYVLILLKGLPRPSSWCQYGLRKQLDKYPDRKW